LWTRPGARPDSNVRLRDIGDARLEVEEALTAPSDAMTPGSSPAQPVREFEFQRLTDFAGLEESPAVSPGAHKRLTLMSRAEFRHQREENLRSGVLESPDKGRSP
jgi:hypothetical protein